MKEKIVNNLFELWKYIGCKTNSLHIKNSYCYVIHDNHSWPSKVFELASDDNVAEKISKDFIKSDLPNSISLMEDISLETQLLNNDFVLKSTVKGMYLDVSRERKLQDSYDSIERVDSIQKAVIFAEIASKSFGYELLSSTIIPLINASRLKLFIGKHGGKYVSCGMVHLDSNDISGLHMIGTLPEYRGKGLGKVMTGKLMYEAHKNESNQVVLVASIAGERIYSKLGFKLDGNLKSYSLK